MTHAHKQAPIKVKFLSKSKPGFDPSIWLRRFPNGRPEIQGCRFIFDRDCRDYDWLVVYDDLPSVSGERFTLWTEKLACPKSNTLLITTEPAIIKVYGSGFVQQFGRVLTSQEPDIIQSPGAIRAQCGLVYFYGGQTEKGSYDYIANHQPLDKSSDISTVCSSKVDLKTMHSHRVRFTQWMQTQLPQLDVFGHGVRYIEDKSDALDPYRYHIAIENHICQHHWTEKLSDSFLGLSLPFYFGCPNIADYFPEESYIPIEIGKFNESLETIQRAIQDNEYEKRLPALKEAKRLALEKYSLFPWLTQLIQERHDSSNQAPIGAGEVIHSRHKWRSASIGNRLRFLLECVRIRSRTRAELKKLTKNWDTQNQVAPKRKTKTRA